MTAVGWLRGVTCVPGAVTRISSSLQINRSTPSLLLLMFSCPKCSKAQFFSTSRSSHYKTRILRFSSAPSNPPNGGDQKSAAASKSQNGKDPQRKNSGEDGKSGGIKATGKSGDEIVVKVVPTVKTTASSRGPKTDLNKPYTANIFITPLRSMDEYLLTPQELERLPKTKRRSPYPELDDITVYLRKDVEEKAVEKWGSLEALHKERLNLMSTDHRYRDRSARWGRLPPHYILMQDPFFEGHTNTKKEEPRVGVFKTGPGRVVLYAICVNTFNAVLKFVAWLYTGSHSMFSEFIHSMADTANQCILAFGIHQSHKKPDLEHPYGWSSFRNITSLISGVAIFCIGSGLSAYHGVVGLYAPEPFENVFWAASILAGSFISESATLLVAVNEVKKSAKELQMPLFKYILSNRDPMSIVVLLEDAAAVVGVTIAASCMLLSHYWGSAIPDAVGSLLIATLLGGVASFIVYANTVALLGRSIPPEKKQELMKELETDRMIRALHDVKATAMSSNFVRFKAEVDFDGRELTRLYMDNQDMEIILKEMQSMQSIEQVECFMLKHGEAIVDTMGAEVDRIEKNLKTRHPELRHVDLEQL